MARTYKRDKNGKFASGSGGGGGKRASSASSRGKSLLGTGSTSRTQQKARFAKETVSIDQMNAVEMFRNGGANSMGVPRTSALINASRNGNHPLRATTRAGNKVRGVTWNEIHKADAARPFRTASAKAGAARLKRAKKK